MFANVSKILILLENGHPYDAVEEKENKMQGFSKTFLLRGPLIRDWALVSELC
jgi:hypothetical protein